MKDLSLGRTKQTMLTCPMCKKTLPESTQQCPRCSTDLSLLTDYVEHLHDGVARADDLTRQGQLGEAVWAYLEVLEVDPDNAVARRQVGRVATVVREFDRAAPGRRWLKRLGQEARFRHWLYTRLGLRLSSAWIFWLVILVGLILFFGLGFFFGFRSGRFHAEEEAKNTGNSGFFSQEAAYFVRGSLDCYFLS
jgi:hypothetical protein